MKQLKSTKIQKELLRNSLDESVNMILNIDESFTKKISSKKNTDLVSEPSFVPDNGVYILHETLGVKTVEGWNTKFNNGVIGILLIEDEHQIVIALEDSPNRLHWSMEDELVNQPIKNSEDAESDFNGDEYCRNLNSPDFPAAYYCLNYKKGGRNWYLPSTGELWMIYRHFEEIQNALSIVEGYRLDLDWYWSSSENTYYDAWYLTLNGGDIRCGYKIHGYNKVRPVSNFRKKNTLRESFTKKISSKKNTDLISKPAFVLEDGVYILHETLGVKDIEEWNPKDNDGVVGILLIEDEHQLVVALEDSPEDLRWSNFRKLVNRPIEDDEFAEFDFNGEEYCRNLNSPDFPAAYYCLNYNKGGRNWYLPSSGELWLIYHHLEEIQNALSIVGGQEFVTVWNSFEGNPWYWSSTEGGITLAWGIYISDKYIDDWYDKIKSRNKVRPVSNFRKNPLKESFTKKIKSTQKNTLKESFTKKIKSVRKSDLNSEPSFVPSDGVYILHETLGVRGVEGWNTKFNEGVIGILVVEDEQQIVIALEDSPENLRWSNFLRKVNQPIKNREDAKSDFNGEKYCRNLNSPDFPAAYYCLNYNKGGRNWFLPSSGEWMLIKRHLKEIQNALSIVEGQKFVTDGDDNMPCYWSSTEGQSVYAWGLNLNDDTLYVYGKFRQKLKVRPVSVRKNTLKESFTKKISSKKNTDLISKPSFALEDGVYILHETLGVKDVEGWNTKFNNGVVGILLIEDDHKIVVALEDSPKILHWSMEEKKINQSIFDEKDAESDFNGEEYCKNLNSPDFPAAYYCLNYNKGGRDWHLPSSGELWMIYRHLEEIQNALSIVGGKKFVTGWKNFIFPDYWSSTEGGYTNAWYLDFSTNTLRYWSYKADHSKNVRPVSNFRKKNTLKESFTKKISSKKNTDLISKPSFVLDNGVYILHETLGVKDIEEWNPKFNNGVVGILVVEDDHKIVVALEDSPENLCWSMEEKLVNQPVKDKEDAKSDFNGKEYCQKLNSPEFPAAYYCLNYKKGGRDWYLPSSGELWLIYRHFEEIQNALSIVGGQKFDSKWDNDEPWYWSSTEDIFAKYAWGMYLTNSIIILNGNNKVFNIHKVRPVSAFSV